LASRLKPECDSSGRCGVWCDRTHAANEKRLECPIFSAADWALPEVRPEPGARLVVFRRLDGSRGSLPLEDLLAADVLLADAFDGPPLGVAHSAPVRLVAPGHYGYKNI
jgi:hypothetical protein